MKGVGDDDYNESQEVEDQDAESGFIKKMKATRDKLKLGQHHKMERFTILTGGAFVFLFLFTIMAFVSHRSDVENLESSQAAFTETFAYSLSGQQGQLRGVYGDESKTDVMVLFQMDDPTAMSANADNYELFVTKDGRQSLAPDYPLDVEFSLFGSTGYGLVRFQSTNDAPIESQTLNVTIRANASLAAEGDGAVETEEGVVDESFNDFDQASMIVNPGSVNIEPIEGLATGEDDPTKLYIPLVAEEQEAAILEKIAARTSELGTFLNRSDEYLGRIESAGFVPPEEPWYIAGDEISEDGHFVSNEDVARSHDFDYTEHTIRDGYLNQVIDGLYEYEEYMASKSDQDQDPVAQATEYQRESVPAVESLTKTDGSTVALEMIITGSSSATNVAGKDATESLLTTWGDYLSAKQDLQRQLMGELLILDAEVRSQAELFTNKEDAATLY